MSLPALRFVPEERADLHLHSTWSDGTLSPDALAAACAVAGLQVVALTDHAELRGVAPAALACAARGVYVVPGVELNAAEADLLGYFVDEQAPELSRLCERLRQQRVERARAVVARLGSLGISVDWGAVRRLAAPAAPMRTHIARQLVAMGAAQSVDEAFATLLGRAGRAHVPAVAPSVTECVAAVAAAGGVSVVAHPHFLLRPGGPSAEQLLTPLAAAGVVGCEVWRSGSDAPPPEVQLAFTRAARSLGLLVLQGSDFHGAPVDRRRPGLRSVGGDVLEALNDRVPDQALHRSLFKRMHWRQHNLRPDELDSSLRPELVELAELRHEHLLGRPRPAPAAPHGFEGCPFVLVRAGALDRVAQVVDAVERCGGQGIERRAAGGYPTFAWDLYDLGADPVRGRRSLLNFELDRHLYGPDAERCVFVFFRGPLRRSFRSLKIDLRRQLGRIRFYRVRCGELEDTCLTTYVHMPEEEHVALECWRLAGCGVPTPRPG